MTSYVFAVYVAGESERTTAAVRTMRLLCESRLPGRHRLEIIDTVEHPDLAERDAILIAPTVIRIAPHPQWRVYGDLIDHDRVAAALGIPERAEHQDGNDL